MTRRKYKPHVPAARAQVNGQALTPAQDQLWRAASQDLASADRQRRRRGELTLRALEAELIGRDEGDRTQRGIDETIALGRARGELIEVSKGPVRRIRNHSRDGLATLAATGAISARQQRAGLVYRDLYEATDPERDLRSQMASAAMSGAGGNPEAGPAEAWRSAGCGCAGRWRRWRPRCAWPTATAARCGPCAKSPATPAASASSSPAAAARPSTAARSAWRWTSASIISAFAERPRLSNS